MRPVNEVVVLIAGVVHVAVNEAVVRAGAGPILCGQVCGLVPKVGTVPLKTYILS